VKSKQETITKDTLSLAGEFAVASELCKRGKYAQLTLGNRKRTDLLVDNEKALLRVEVKSKQGDVWPAVKGIYLDNSLIVFVDFCGKKLEERPDFFVLTAKEWKSHVQNRLMVCKPGATITNENVLVGSDGFKGTTVKIHQIDAHREAWDKFDPPKQKLRK
jgi:hypothetical protein